VRSGSQLVDESGKVLGEIMESVKRVSDIVAEIAAASEEQAGGIDQMNNAVTQMDDTTQQNAALVEEAASAAKAMEQQAQHLVTHMAFFRTQGAASIAAPSDPSVPERRQSPASTRATLRSVPPPLARPKLAQQKSAQPKLAKASGGDAVWREF
jgi:hypothetical protein